MKSLKMGKSALAAFLGVLLVAGSIASATADTDQPDPSPPAEVTQASAEPEPAVVEVTAANEASEAPTGVTGTAEAIEPSLEPTLSKTPASEASTLATGFPTQEASAPVQELIALEDDAASSEVPEPEPDMEVTSESTTIDFQRALIQTCVDGQNSFGHTITDVLTWHLVLELFDQNGNTIYKAPSIWDGERYTDWLLAGETALVDLSDVGGTVRYHALWGNQVDIEGFDTFGTVIDCGEAEPTPDPTEPADPLPVTVQCVPGGISWWQDHSPYGVLIAGWYDADGVEHPIGYDYTLHQGETFVLDTSEVPPGAVVGYGIGWGQDRYTRGYITCGEAEPEPTPTVPTEEPTEPADPEPSEVPVASDLLVQCASGARLSLTNNVSGNWLAIVIAGWTRDGVETPLTYDVDVYPGGTEYVDISSVPADQAIGYWTGWLNLDDEYADAVENGGSITCGDPGEPTEEPTEEPTDPVDPDPSNEPSEQPSVTPSPTPSAQPSSSPSEAPTQKLSKTPSEKSVKKVSQSPKSGKKPTSVTPGLPSAGVSESSKASVPAAATAAMVFVAMLAVIGIIASRGRKETS